MEVNPQAIFERKVVVIDHQIVVLACYQNRSGLGVVYQASILG